MALEDKLAIIHAGLKTGTYKPVPVKRVEIEKEDGSKRPLGISTVKDRVVQQALRQIIEPIFEPDFHPSSYVYHQNRSCQNAVAKAEQFLRRYGLTHVVDMDLSKCFDTQEEIEHVFGTFFVTMKGEGVSITKFKFDLTDTRIMANKNSATVGGATLKMSVSLDGDVEEVDPIPLPTFELKRIGKRWKFDSNSPLELDLDLDF